MSGHIGGTITPAKYWSDASQARIAFVDDILRQVPSSSLSNAGASSAIDEEMEAIRSALRSIGTRHNALTLTCRIPTEILAEIFLFYQSQYRGIFPDCSGRQIYGGHLWWVPGVAHICRHWRQVALGYPRLWANVSLSLNRNWGTQMLSLSKASPISISLVDPDSCEAFLPALPWSTEKLHLDPIEVLSQHLFHIQDLIISSCPCNIIPWIRLLETAAPLLESLSVTVNLHLPDTTRDNPVPIPENFLSTHPRLRKLSLLWTFLSDWTACSLPLLTALNIDAPDPQNFLDRRNLVLPSHEQFLDCMQQMPALETVHLSHCLPPLSPMYSTRTVSLQNLKSLFVRDRVDRCRQVIEALDFPESTSIAVHCWSPLPPSEYDCLRIVPTLSQHLCRGDTTPTPPQALSLRLGVVFERTELLLDAWRNFTPPTVDEDRKPYFGPKPSETTIHLQCDWEQSDAYIERRSLIKVAEAIPLEELRFINIGGVGDVWGAKDWHDTFARCVEITHVSAVDSPSESLVTALSLTDDVEAPGSAPPITRGGPPLFPEMVSLTLSGANLLRSDHRVWDTFVCMMHQRQESPECVTILDRIELRVCTVAEWMVRRMGEYAAVVVWDSVNPETGWGAEAQPGGWQSEADGEEDNVEDENGAE
ncbi:hypothetical protein BC834DRAFT_374372 [Gloeopeniophorella convolvens]|nr:hypothetical protein BC834DRAFT_374372 [Gloeopeniophorella convolvens]